MKKGMRVVSLPSVQEVQKKLRSYGLPEPRNSKRTGKAKAKPVAVASSAREEVPDQRVVSSPAVETKSPERVSTSPVAEPRPTPPITSSPTVHTPFRNPDLNDKPLHWSPRMFKPEIDRYNWSWSEWDSPSREFEDVTYETEDWPIRDPFARFPPELRKRLQEIMAMAPKTKLSTTHSTDSLADTVRYEEVNLMSSFGSSSDESVRSKLLDDDSWVVLNDVPWPPNLLRMLLSSEEQDRRLAAKGFFDREWAKSPIQPASDLDVSHQSLSQDFSSLPQPDIDVDSRPSSSKSLSTPSASPPDMSVHSQVGDEESNISTSSSSTHSASIPLASTRSASPEFSTWIEISEKKWPDQLFNAINVAEENKRKRAQEEALAAAGVSTHSASASDVSDVSGRSQSPEFSTYVDVDEKKWSDGTFDLFNMMDEDRRARAIRDALAAAGPPAFECGSDASDLSQSSEFSSPWFKLDVEKWSDDTFQMYTEIEECRRRGPETTTTLSVSGLDASLPLETDAHSAAQQHFHSFLQPSSPSAEIPSIPTVSQPVHVHHHHTAPVQQFPPSRPTRSSRHFHTMRQLPSARAVEPHQSPEEPSRGSGFGWKSLACVAVAAATVGAGLAYWFSG